VRTTKCLNKYVPGRTSAEWFADNKEHISAYRKNYAIVNKDKLTLKAKITFVCECGSICQVGEKGRHQKSKKHLAQVANLLMKRV
jgi:hypothetical protein